MKKLILYGCGNSGVEWLEHIGKDRVYAFCDSDETKVGTVIAGKKVLSLVDVCEMHNEILIFISVSFDYKDEILNKLFMLGLADCVAGLPYFDKNIYTAWNTKVDINSQFEGRNYLGNNVVLTNCIMGYASYMSRNSNFNNVKIGRYTCVGPNVKLIIGQHPTRNFVSIHPMFYSTQQIIHKSYVMNNLFEEYRFTNNGYTVEIGNDVWIGNSVSIMEGVSIADGTIIASGANVVKDTEPYSIIGGNPAKLIRYRFEEREIEFLMKLKWWDKDEKWIDEHAKYFDNISNLMMNI